ncbi:MAG: class I SAM-dependent methyltransferase [Rubrivivax sp.]
MEHAKRHNNDPRIVFQVGDACAIDFPDHSFDRVLSLLVLHFVPERIRPAEMRRVARPGAGSGSRVGCARWLRCERISSTRQRRWIQGKRPPCATTRPMTRPGELAKAWLHRLPRGREGIEYSNGFRIIRGLLGPLRG